MARLIEYVGRGQICDAATKRLVSPHDVVREFNIMARMLEAADGRRQEEVRRDGIAPHRTLEEEMT